MSLLVSLKLMCFKSSLCFLFFMARREHRSLGRVAFFVWTFGQVALAVRMLCIVKETNGLI